MSRLNLKKVLFYFVFILITAPANLFAQKELCKYCYVWEFSTYSGERNETTRLFTTVFEDILSQKSECNVLQRSKYARLRDQINNEKMITSISEAPPNIRKEINQEAEKVVFGVVDKDFQGNISLRISFENLKTTKMVSNTVFLIGENAYNYNKRKEILTKFVDEFLGFKIKEEDKRPNGTPNDQLNKNSSDFPITRNIGDWNIEIISIKHSGSNFICHFKFTSKYLDRELILFNNAELYDDAGEVYHSEEVNLRGGGSFTGGNYRRKAVADVPIKGMVSFKKLSTQATEVALLEIQLSGEGIQPNKVQFRNIPIK